MKRLSTESFSSKGAFIIARLIREAEKELEIFNKLRLDLVKKYADKDDTGEVIVIDGAAHVAEDKIELYNNELNEIISSEIELNVTLLSINLLDNLIFTPEEALALEPFIKIE